MSRCLGLPITPITHISHIPSQPLATFYTRCHKKSHHKVCKTCSVSGCNYRPSFCQAGIHQTTIYWQVSSLTPSPPLVHITAQITITITTTAIVFTNFVSVQWIILFFHFDVFPRQKNRKPGIIQKTIVSLQNYILFLSVTLNPCNLNLQKYTL